MIATILSPKKLGILAISSFLLITSCTKVDAGDGPKVTERIDVQDFDKISYEIGGQLNYTQGDLTQVSVTTSAAALEAIDIYVEDKTLHITREKGFNIVNSDQLVFDVMDDDAYDIYVCGSGNVTADFDENYHFTEHNLKVSGSGNIDADYVYADLQTTKISGSGNISIGALYADKAKAKISGSGDIRYAGVTSLSDFEIHGSGNIQAFDLESFQSEVFNCGSGNASVRVQSLLDSDINGSGNVSYKGNPTMVSAISGSGNLIDAN